jgi:hypothetical protein
VFSPGADTGGIFNTGTALFTNITIAGNQVPHSTITRVTGSIFSGGQTVVVHTIPARKSSHSRSIAGNPDCTGLVTSLGTNLIGDPTGCTITLQPTDLTGDPGLDTFTDDGTPGNGHFPLLPTSQAIDTGNDAVVVLHDRHPLPTYSHPEDVIQCAKAATVEAQKPGNRQPVMAVLHGPAPWPLT